MFCHEKYVYIYFNDNRRICFTNFIVISAKKIFSFCSSDHSYNVGGTSDVVLCVAYFDVSHCIVFRFCVSR